MRGSCQCGAVTYELTGDPIALVFCFCTDCQKISTGVGTYSLIVASTNFQLTSGDINYHERDTFDGGRNRGHFCTVCSNRIYHRDADDPKVVRVKAGTLDLAKDLVPDAYAWVSRAPKWVKIPEAALKYDTQPTLEQGLRDLQVRRAAASPA